MAATPEFTVNQNQRLANQRAASVDISNNTISTYAPLEGQDLLISTENVTSEKISEQVSNEQVILVGVDK